MKDEQSQIRNGDVEPAPTPTPGMTGPMVCVRCGTSYPPETRYCPLDGSLLRPPQSAEDQLLGTVIDERYYLMEKLGEGGMGTVYLGEHVRTHRRCAVKVNSLQANDPETISRFLREATNAGRINHPHVATVYDFGEVSEGVSYLAMEYVEGEPLSRLIAREGALPPARAVEIARQVAEGVAAAHELGIVHRDLKPGNILVGRDRKRADVVKVVDFGIARATADAEQHLTRTGLIIGTPEYMSPEQLIGDPVDGRSDIYSLGCILYQMVTGEQAFGGAAAQVITRRLTEAPPRPRDRKPDIPKALDDLIVRALGRLPHERFPTMEAMLEAMLSAPTGALITGPRRLSAWLGGETATPAPGDAPTGPTTAAASPFAAAAPSTGPHTLSPTDTPATDADMHPDTGARDPDDDEAAERLFDEPAPTPGPFAAFGATLDSLPLEETEPELDRLADGIDADSDRVFTEEPAAGEPSDGARDVPPEAAIAGAGFSGRRARLLAGAAVVTVILVGFLMTRDEADALPEPDAVTEAIVVPPPAPSDSVVAGLWAELAAAFAEEQPYEYDAAFTRLRAAEVHVTALLAQFPGNAALLQVADSVTGQVAQTLVRCEADRTVALNRNRTPPACVPESEPDTAAVQS